MASSHTWALPFHHKPPKVANKASPSGGNILRHIICARRCRFGPENPDLLIFIMISPNPKKSASLRHFDDETARYLHNRFRLGSRCIDTQELCEAIADYIRLWGLDNFEKVVADSKANIREGITYHEYKIDY